MTRFFVRWKAALLTVLLASLVAVHPGCSASLSGSCPAGRTCDDHDPCTTNDTCREGGSCAGDPLRCEAPPASTCKDELFLRVFASPGTCYDGQCRYAEEEVVCPEGCNNDDCVADPCAGITCTDPPPPTCSSEMTLRVFAATGTCTQGLCTYPFDDSTCPAGCAADACRADAGDDAGTPLPDADVGTNPPDADVGTNPPDADVGTNPPDADVGTNPPDADAGPPGTVLHVGPGQPYSTIQAAVNAASAGDMISVHAGTYHETVTIDSAKSNLTIQAHDPSHPPELDGADQGFANSAHTWTHVQDKIYRTTYNLPYAHKTAQTFVPTSYGGTGYKGDPIMTVYEDDIWLKGYEGAYCVTEPCYPYSTVADLDPSTDLPSSSGRELRIAGRFMYDDSTNQLYVWTAKEHGEDHPSNHKYHIPVLKNLVVIDAPGVTLKNLVLKHTYYYAVDIKSNGDDAAIKNCYIVNTGPWAIKSYNAQNVKIVDSFIQLKGFYERQDYSSVRFTILKGSLIYLIGNPLTDAKNCEVARNMVTGTYNITAQGQGCTVHDNIVSKSQSILVIPNVPGHLTPYATPGYLHNVKVYNNVFHHADFSVFTSYNTWTAGLNNYYGPTWFYRNVIYAVPKINKDGCSLSPCDSTPSIFIYNNTFALGVSVVHHPYDYPVNKRTVYRNNLVHLRHNKGMEMYWIYSGGEESKGWSYFPFTVGPDSDYNAYYRQPIANWTQIARFRYKEDVDAGIYTSYKVGEFSLMQSETGIDPHSVEADPLFVNGSALSTVSPDQADYDQLSGMDYRQVIAQGYQSLFNAELKKLRDYFKVQSTSVVINRGTLIPASWPDTVSIDDGKPDIGAVEY